MTGSPPRSEDPGPRRVLVYLHGDPWFIDPHEPICPICGQKIRVVW
jgi:hypothetical protein